MLTLYGRKIIRILHNYILFNKMEVTIVIDLLNIQPHQVSNDLRGYSVMFYGE
jgi:hypothetical protein